MIDLTRACVMTAGAGDARIDRSADLLIEEIQRRTGVALPRCDKAAGSEAVIVLLAGAAGDLAPAWRKALDRLNAPGPEGFRLALAEGKQTAVLVEGADARGLLFGVGRLLRMMNLRAGTIRLAPLLAVSSTPHNSLRGHQLGNRPLNNTYEAWSVEQFEQYIRELAIFGANTIEFLPPGADDVAPTAPHMPVDPWEMLGHCSDICDRYDLDVSIWYPNEGKDYTSAEGIERELAERDDIFARMGRLDCLFIPGGDPGGLDADTLFDFSARTADVLRKRHPNARVSLSAQAFHAPDDWLDRFVARAAEAGEWLNEIAFAPWCRIPLPELHERIGGRYPIRRYPDIAHTILCQYPVPRWDRAFARTESREPVNPRPVAFKQIHNLLDSYAVGGATYSEGVNDDVNKVVWADQDWDPATPVARTLADYGRLFFGQDLGEPAVDAILGLERNWFGPIAENASIEPTLAAWQKIEHDAPDWARAGWRLDMHLLRACYDAMLQRRIGPESKLQADALAVLRDAASDEAVGQAREILGRRTAEPVAGDLRDRINELADALWEKIGMQLTTTRHHGQRTVRGAFVDNIDLPLNDESWILAQLAEAEAIDDSGERLAAVRAIATRTDPGPGGRYVDLDAAAMPTVVARGEPWSQDPGFYRSPLLVFDLKHKSDTPLAWLDAAATLYDPPLTIVLRDIEPGDYALRVTFHPDPWGGHVRLTAGDRVLHDEVEITTRGQQVTVPVPAAAMDNGRLELTWTTRNGQLGPRVCELWLMRK